MSSPASRSADDASPLRSSSVPIVVIGEALIDLVSTGEGLAVEAALGGAPFNAARAAARLGAAVEFVGALGTDRFGRALAEQLVVDGVGVRWAPRVERPTTLAIAELTDGAAAYRFYIDGTSAPQLVQGDLAAALGVNDDGRSGARRADGGGAIAPALVLTGGLALVLRPMATTVVDALASTSLAAPIVVDVNCRPQVIADRRRYVADVMRVVQRAAVVKVSDEDLAFLFPELDAVDVARVGAARLLAAGAAAVLVTAGADHTAVVTPDGTTAVPVPPLRAPLVDTIGAGDTFIGGVVAALVRNGVAGVRGISTSMLVDAVHLGHAAAGVVVTRRGADPPMLDDVDVRRPGGSRT